MKDSPQSILIVDDEKDFCLNLSDIFSDLGYEVQVAFDGHAALEMVRERPFDVVLLDLKMPGMDGFELCERIKRVRAGTVTIVVSAYVSPETGQRLFDLGTWHVLHKPVNFSELHKLVQHAMEQPLILVVDDDKELCRSLWDIFRSHNLRVCLASDLHTAEKMLSERSYGVVLLDLKLPDGNGLDLFKFVKQHNSEARTILVTGHQRDPLVREILSEGVDAAYYKPLDVGALVEATREMASNVPNPFPL